MRSLFLFLWVIWSFAANAVTPTSGVSTFYPLNKARTTNMQPPLRMPHPSFSYPTKKVEAKYAIPVTIAQAKEPDALLQSRQLLDIFAPTTAQQ